MGYLYDRIISWLTETIFLERIENITLLSEDIEFVIYSDMQQFHFKFSFVKPVVFL